MAGWHRSQLDHSYNQLPEVVIVACYGIPSGNGQRPPYGHGTAFYELAKNVEQFFKEPFYGTSQHCLLWLRLPTEWPALCSRRFA